MNFNEKLIELRKSRGLSQDELAKKAAPGRNSYCTKNVKGSHLRAFLFHPFLLFKISAASPTAIPTRNTPPQMAQP